MTRDENLYGVKCVELPAPQFIIFYNGEKEQPDRSILKLSDAYSVKEEHPALELTAVMLNIHRGHDEKFPLKKPWNGRFENVWRKTFWQNF